MSNKKARKERTAPLINQVMGIAKEAADTLPPGHWRPVFWWRLYYAVRQRLKNKGDRDRETRLARTALWAMAHGSPDATPLTLQLATLFGEPEPDDLAQYEADPEKFLSMVAVAAKLRLKQEKKLQHELTKADEAKAAP